MFPGSPHSIKLKGQGPGEIYHMRNVIGAVNLITCLWRTNELTHDLWTIVLFQLRKLYK